MAPTQTKAGTFAGNVTIDAPNLSSPVQDYLIWETQAVAQWFMDHANEITPNTLDVIKTAGRLCYQRAATGEITDVLFNGVSLLSGKLGGGMDSSQRGTTERTVTPGHSP